MTLKWTPERYPEYGIGCLSVPKKTKEKGSTNGSTFTPLYNGIEDSYGVDSIGYYWVIGVLEGNTTLVGVTTHLLSYYMYWKLILYNFQFRGKFVDTIILCSHYSLKNV